MNAVEFLHGLEVVNLDFSFQNLGRT